MRISSSPQRQKRSKRSLDNQETAAGPKNLTLWPFRPLLVQGAHRSIRKYGLRMLHRHIRGGQPLRIGERQNRSPEFVSCQSALRCSKRLQAPRQGSAAYCRPSRDRTAAAPREGCRPCDKSPVPLCGQGDTSFRESNQPRAMETLDDLVLCLVAWRDDLETPPVWAETQNMR